MKIISVFNNKGGVGKSTLTYHLGNSLAELGHKVLMVDLDPQCNLTICTMKEDKLHQIWKDEDAYIDDFEKAFNDNKDIIKSTRSVHFILKPTEDGISELEKLPPAFSCGKNIDIIPGRLSLHRYENRIAERWSGVYQGDNLAIRTVTNIRNFCERYSEQNNYDFILIDTSPSLGVLNKVIISTVDGFFIPVQPDMFSLYGIRNIGNSLEIWQKEFNTMYSLMSNDKRSKFPEKFVQFLGYTIYNARKSSKQGKKINKYDLAQAQYQYVSQIPKTIIKYILETNRTNFTPKEISEPISESAIMYTHNTFPAMAQALKCPMWKVPDTYKNLEQKDASYIAFLNQNGFEYNQGNNGRLQDLGNHYREFTKDLLGRIKKL